jgi:RNA polymerase sigma factor (TIGR02999 family)
MSDVTRTLSRIESGDPSAAEELLPLVYDELRKLAAAKLFHENPGQTLQATALVHEAYLRVTADRKSESNDTNWDGRGHFYAAAAEAMRRILVDNARRRKSQKRGREGGRQSLDADALAAPELAPDLLALDESLLRLAAHDSLAAQLVTLRFFSGLDIAQAATTLNISPRTANRLWVYAKAWLYRDLEGPAAGV